MVFLRDNGAEVIVEDAYDGSVTDLVLAIAAGSLREVTDIADRLEEMVRQQGENTPLSPQPDRQ